MQEGRDAPGDARVYQARGLGIRVTPTASLRAEAYSVSPLTLSSLPALDGAHMRATTIAPRNRADDRGRAC